MLLFNYLDRGKMAKMVEAVAPGGFLLAETFLEAQKAFGWGPPPTTICSAPASCSSWCPPSWSCMGVK